MARHTCYRCRRPSDRCLCSHIFPVDNRVPVMVIQHPSERHHAFNTARIAGLSLRRFELLRTSGSQLQDVPSLRPGAALLFPGDDATDLNQLSPHERPDQLVVLDGTWPQAKSIYHANPWLQHLPKVKLNPTEPSAYRIRSEPEAHCLSTIESIAAALTLCEPENAQIHDLLSGFHALIRSQVQRTGREPGQARFRRRPKQNQAHKLRTRWDKVVILYVESTPPGAAAESLDFLQICAYRPASGDRFDRLCRPAVLPSDYQLHQMRLDVTNAAPFSDCHDAWRRFREPDDLYLAWSWFAPQVALDRLGETSKVIRLRSAYCNVRRAAPGHLHELIQREGLSTRPLTLMGRAGRRVANAVALAEWLGHRSAQDPQP